MRIYTRRLNKGISFLKKSLIGSTSTIDAGWQNGRKDKNKKKQAVNIPRVINNNRERSHFIYL